MAPPRREPAPFLRSPPFPGVPARVAAVSVAEPQGTSPDEATACGKQAGDMAQIVAALRLARVGGSFWGPAAPVRPHLAELHNRTTPAGIAGADLTVIGSVTPAGGAERLADDADPWSVCTRIDTLWTESDGDHALVAWLLGRPVRRFDGTMVPDAVLGERLAARLAAARYRNCFTGDAITPAEAIDLLACWRRQFDAGRRIAAVTGVARWKRREVARMLWDGVRRPAFLKPAPALARAVRNGGAVAIWPSRVPAGYIDEAASRRIPLVRVEDGFVRSRGLGSDLAPPQSIVADARGIYYAPDPASDLAVLLAETRFPPELVERAARLRRRMVETGTSKYGDDAAPTAAPLPPARRIVLAIGQVDDDLSVREGGAGIAGNAAFLAQVRAAEPDAFILYRPHPDVLAGHRAGHVPEAEARRHADAIATSGSLLALLARVDAVHVLSSLTGFEALLRQVPVVVHGQPFYAGWGLTRDLAPPATGRGRRLLLDELVAGALILYPRYLDPVTGLPCPPEVLVERLAAAPRASSPLIGLRRLQGRLHRVATLARRGR